MSAARSCAARADADAKRPVVPTKPGLVSGGRLCFYLPVMKNLFITSNRIGDAVQSTGILSALVQRHPEARVTVAAGAVSAPLFSTLPQLDRLLVMKKRPLAGHWRQLWRETVGTRWDLVVDLRASKFTWTVLSRRSRVRTPDPLTDDKVVTAPALAAGSAEATSSA